MFRIKVSIFVLFVCAYSNLFALGTDNILVDVVVTDNVSEVIITTPLEKMKGYYNLDSNEELDKSIRVIDSIDNDLFAYTEKMNLIYPPKDLVTVKNTVMVKGFNRYLTDVFVNGDRIDIRNDGRFYHDLDLPVFGKLEFLFGFTRPDYSIINVRRKIIKLYAPVDFNDYSEDKQEFVYVMNTPYIYNPKLDRKFSDYFSRADLAYFIMLLNDVQVLPSEISVFSDVHEDYWAADAIKYVIDNKLMMEFPDGKFRPDNPVSKIEYIMALVKAGKYDLDYKRTVLPYKDIDPGHWTVKYIKVAREQGFIPKSGILGMKKKLSLADFILLVKDLPLIKQAVSSLLSFNDGFEIEENWEQEKNKPIFSYLELKKEEIAQKTKIQIIEPKNKQIFFNNKVSFKGTIFPAEMFLINDKEVMPDINGNFGQEFAIENGANTFNVFALGKREEFIIFGFKPYFDLFGHWIENTAAKLQFIGVLPEEDYFNPDYQITREEFAYYLAKAFNLPKDIDKVEVPKDVLPTSLYFTEVLSVINAGILKRSKQGVFRPDATISKAEAVTAIVRACDFELEDSNALVFQDISEKHWAYPYIVTAVHSKIIVPGAYFFPRKKLSKAELASMLAKTPIIKAKLEVTFSK
jgi:hypothetical protein